MVGTGLLVTASVQAFDHPGQTDVQESDLTIQVVHLLLEAAAAVSSPVKSNRPRHEVDGYNKAKGQDGVFWVTFILLEDVHAREGEKGNPGNPEEATEQHVQEIEEESKEER